MTIFEYRFDLHLDKDDKAAVAAVGDDVDEEEQVDPDPDDNNNDGDDVAGEIVPGTSNGAAVVNIFKPFFCSESDFNPNDIGKRQESVVEAGAALATAHKLPALIAVSGDIRVAAGRLMLLLLLLPTEPTELLFVPLTINNPPFAGLKQLASINVVKCSSSETELPNTGLGVDCALKFIEILYKS